MKFILDLDVEFNFQRPVCHDFSQEALLSIKYLLIVCLHQEQPFKSEIFNFLGHKRDPGMGLQKVKMLVELEVEIYIFRNKNVLTYQTTIIVRGPRKQKNRV